MVDIILIGAIAALAMVSMEAYKRLINLHEEHERKIMELHKQITFLSNELKQRGGRK